MEKDSRKCSPRLFSIPPAAPFLSTLVNALISGELIDGFTPGSDALALSSVTIYVPTRRAARALQAEFVARIEKNALLLPRILPLGDIEEDQFIFEQQSDGALELDPTIGSLERQLLLTQLIQQWTSALEKTSKTLFGDEALSVPASLSDAAWLANDLATLMDTVSTEEADWDLLEDLVPEEHADWWKLTLGFLKIATKSWPLILQERGSMDVATRRGLLLHRQAEQYRLHGSAGPVIAAGSTGSIPATASLLGAISHLKNGAVILPGLDRDMSDEVWQDLSAEKAGDAGPLLRTSHEQASAPGHPQYGLKKLLDGMGVARDNVHHIGGIDDSSIGYARLRETIVNLSMEPSKSTDNWPGFRSNFTEQKSITAFSGVSLIEAESEPQETLAIALAMREVLNDESKRAALVTPDRVLARRVSVELKRFGIEIDDSAGVPLSETIQGSFVRLVMAVALAPSDPVNLLALIKHPLASFGMQRDEVLRAGEVLELGVIRGNVAELFPGNYHQSVDDALNAPKNNDAYQSAYKKQISEENRQDALLLAGAMDRALVPLYCLLDQDTAVSLDVITRITIETLEAVAQTFESQTGELYSGQTGDALSGFLGDLLLRSSDGENGIDVRPFEWPALYEALLGSRPVRLHRQTHSRLSILGPLEARLQQVDRVILGGLNESTWPSSTRNDPFLNRPMKQVLTLEPPERRIGLAAHDFQMLLGTREVILTRSKRAENAPTVTSRWVQRLLTLAGEKASESIRLSGQKYMDWATHIDRRPSSEAGNTQIVSRPEPKPHLDIRPKTIRVTEVETWIRDPYAIYAKYVLGLEPLETIRRQIDARERGVLYHAVFEKFVKSWLISDVINENELVKQIGVAEFSKYNLPKDVYSFWWPRFLDIAQSFVEWEAERTDKIAKSFIELSATAEVGGSGFSIRGKADRIDLLLEEGHSIIDYKTGLSPSVKQANSLLAPQLPLEGAMALRGAFNEFKAEQIKQLTYVRLRPSGGFKVDQLGVQKDCPDSQELSTNAWAALEELVSAYESPDKGYLSRARPFRQGDISGDYDHLARVMEWSLDEDDSGDAA